MDLDPIDIAEGLKKLYDFAVTANPKTSIHQFAIEVSKNIGLKEREIYNYLSLVNLAPEMKEILTFCFF